MKKKLVGMAATVAVFLMAASASAVPIQGTILFGGVNQLTGGTDFESATGIDFQAGFVLQPGTNGSYAGLPVGTPATYQDFTFDPVLNPSPVAPLWTLTFAGKTYSFDLKTITVDVHTDLSLGLSGTGTLKITGFDDTNGRWGYTTQYSAQQAVLSFSATSTPEPATMLLLGTGLLGLGLMRRRKQVR